MVTGGRVAMSMMMLSNCKGGYVVLGSQVAGAARGDGHKRHQVVRAIIELSLLLLSSLLSNAWKDSSRLV